MQSHAEFEAIVSEVQLEYGFTFSLKEEQLICLRKLMNGISVFGQLPTGFGKSAIFTLFPLIMEKILRKKQTALVISPLRSLMNDQLNIMSSHDVRSACIMKNMTADSISVIRSGDVTIILSSPEAAMLWLKELTSSPLSSQMCLLCFDEAHCISQWGLDFRPDYRKVADIVSLFEVPTLVLTATATKKVYLDLCNTLALPDDTELVARLPDRPNIYLHLERVVERYEDVLQWLIYHVSEHKEHCKKSIIYCRNIKTCENIYMWLMEELEDSAFAGARSSSTRIIEMMHSRTDKSSTSRILEDFPKANSHIRIVVATVAFGIGVQIQDVDLIIHWGLESSLTYWQEVGRCARDGRVGLAITYAYSRSITLCDDPIMKIICNVDESPCIRKTILNEFLLPGMTPFQAKELECDGKCETCFCFLCKCCSNCLKLCKCAGKFQAILDRI